MAEPFVTVRGAAAPLPLDNVDTDVIIRIERLTGPDLARIGDFAFEALRFLPDGADNPSFPFNQPRWRDAPILIAGSNFGCGSSRELAVNAILAMGVRCVIADSFGDIFYANCFQNGLLPVRLDAGEIATLMAAAERHDDPFEVDLQTCLISVPDGTYLTFEIDQFRREAMLAGIDDIGLTLRDADRITQWQSEDHARRPWVWDRVEKDTATSGEIHAVGV